MRPFKFNLHAGATLLSDDPRCVLTPAAPWSYAASYSVEGQAGGDTVAELTIRVRTGSAGVSYTDRTGQNLRHEVVVASAAVPSLLQQVIQPDDRGLMMIRTLSDGVAVEVEIHGFAVRPVSVDELRAADTVPALGPQPGWSAFFGDHAVSVAEQIRSLRFRRLQRQTRQVWIEGLSVIVAPQEQMSRALYVSQTYEPDTAMVLQSWLTPGAVFLDIGANVGLFTLLGSRWVGATGRVIAVEPSPRERQRLDAHLRLNAVDNVDVVAAAVADREGTGELMVASPERSGLNTLGRRFAYDDVTIAERVSVPLVTLDAIVQGAGLTRVDVIKLDIEGGEVAALEGAATTLRRFRPKLIVEVVANALASCGASVERLCELLRASAYELFEIDEGAALRPVAQGQSPSDGNLVALPADRLQGGRSGPPATEPR